MLVLTFQIGSDRLALDLRQVCEVVPRVQLRRPAGSPGWLAGLFVYRGRVVPVIDLHHLLRAGECPAHLSSRIILVPLPGEKDTLLGLLAAQVAAVSGTNTAEYHLKLAEAYVQSHEYDKAIPEARMALKLKPDSKEAEGMLGEAQGDPCGPRAPRTGCRRREYR